MSYGVYETNPLPEGGHQEFFETCLPHPLAWDDKNLKSITRLRLLSDPGCPVWDVSYCHGETLDGTPCDVELPFNQLPKYGYKRAIVGYAKADGLYAKGLGVLDNISLLC